MLTTPLEYNESNLFEIQKTSVLQNQQEHHIEKKLFDISSLDELKQYIITQTTVILQDFLKKHPMEYNGKYYDVTQESLNNLQLMILSGESAQKLNIPFATTWNAIGETRQYYSLENLKFLLIKIQEYILPYIIQQQEMEKNINNTINKKDLLQFNISYLIN